MSRTIISWILATTLAWAATASAQSIPPGCDQELIQEARSKSWPNGYAIRNGRYCDGAAFFPHSGGAMTVLGVTQGEAGPVDPSSTSIPIRIGEGLTGMLPANTPIALTGRDRRAGGTWRLDGLLPQAGLDIDSKPAMDRLGVSRDQIAVRALIEIEREKWDLPVRVGNTTGKQLTVWIRSPKALATLSLSILDVPPASGSTPTTNVVASNVAANQAFPILLPASLKKGKVVLTFIGDGGGRAGTNILTSRIYMIVPQLTP